MAVAPPPKQVAPWRWLAFTIVLGFAGSLIALAAFATGTYRFGPLLVELKVKPSLSGTTALAIQPITGLKAGAVEAETHSGFLAFEGTVVDVQGRAFLDQAVLRTRDPRTLATFLKDDAKESGQRFALRAGLVALAGGASGGAIIGLIGLRPRRLIQGALAGLILTGVLGFVAYQTYDVNAFRNMTFQSPSSNALPGLP